MSPWRNRSTALVGFSVGRTCAGVDHLARACIGQSAAAGEQRGASPASEAGASTTRGAVGSLAGRCRDASSRAPAVT